MKYIAVINGGVGPDVWDREIEIQADDFSDASSNAVAIAEQNGGFVVSLEQSE